MTAPISVIVFDCDGVLIDSEPLACQAISDHLADLGLSYSPQVVATRFVGFTDEAMAQVISREQGRPLPPDFPQAVAERALALFEARLQPLPGAAGLLARVPIEKAVASNSLKERLVRALELAGLEAFFPLDRVFSSEDVVHPKPAPDLYLLAAQRCGAAPASCLVVEDSVTGVTAARAAGMPVIGFLGASHHGAADKRDELMAAGANVVVESFAQLSAYLGYD